MEMDRLKWNRKFREKPKRQPVCPVVEKYWREAPSGKALDLACGLGRNSLFLAEHGMTVDAVDISDVALDRLEHPHISTLTQTSWKR